MTTRTRTRTALASAAVVALVALGACGDDDDSTEDAATTPDDASAETETAETETETESETETAGSGDDPFCEGFLGVEQAFAEVPENEADIPAFVEERIQPNLELVAGNEPDDIAEEVQVMTDAIEQVASTGDFSAFETPEFSEASAAVYSSLDDACDVEVVEFSAVDFGYEGVPDTLPAGPTAFVMSNDSEAGEAHEFSLVKLSDDSDHTLDELLGMPEEESEQHIETFAGGTFAPAGATGGTVAELTPGRWAYVCFIPVGTVDGEDGSGPPHFVEGMAGEFTVG